MNKLLEKIDGLTVIGLLFIFGTGFMWVSISNSNNAKKHAAEQVAVQYELDQQKKYNELVIFETEAYADGWYPTKNRKLRCKPINNKTKCVINESMLVYNDKLRLD